MIIWFLHKNIFKEISFVLKNIVFDYKIIYLQKNIAKCMQMCARVHNFFYI